VLLETLEQLLALRVPALEILVMDQTQRHAASVEDALTALDRRRAVRWERLERRSITAAMNRGVALARGDVVLFLDDDVRLSCEIVREHARVYEDPAACIVAGQVIQPWQQPLAAPGGGHAQTAPEEPDGFPFNASWAQPARRFIGCNVSLRRQCLLDLGGFDENFAGVAYRFEADFAERALARGFAIRFEPRASLQHLKVPTGGTRLFGNHLRSFSPWHSMGRYYYWLSHPRVPGLARRTLAEAVRSVAAREHLRRPWWIPVSAIAELTGFLVAVAARARGPQLNLDRDSVR
jgi:GT2 family glycosyltransferase